MSKGFSINDILGNTKANAPAGQKMQVVMLRKPILNRTRKTASTRSAMSPC